ncbi:hypothetical protein ON058_06440 [Demequina sp. B12]|uniref:hypothetical protein n=1 Tax=Demequina sp. B12 TaxID=2992757 RepID=UPI00237A4DA0|nr:hypothetical protein [Demequina sp. B12]MDE0573048.1 hypothetical protein [Demequina sp. B12]
MKPVDKKYGAPALPSVNLIPQEIAEATKMRAVKFTAMFAVLIAVGVMVAGYVLALGAKQVAKSGLEDAIDEQRLALASRDSQVETYDALVEYESDAWTLGQIGYGDVDIANLVFSFLEVDTDETAIVGLTYTGPSAAGFSQVNGSDTMVPGVGTIEFSAQTESYEEATALATRIEALPGLEQVTILTESYSTPDGALVWLVNGNVSIVESALTERFIDDEGFVVVDPNAALSTDEPAAAPAPSPSPSEETE